MLYDLFLRNLGRFTVLSHHEEDLIRQYYKLNTYKKKSFLLEQGEVCHFETYVIRGMAKLFTYDEKGDERIMQFAMEDWWMADMFSFVYKTPSEFNIQAIEDLTVLQICKEDKEILFKEVPKLERIFRLLIQNANISLQSRILSIISKTAEERYLELIEKYPAYQQRLTQQQIASFLGISQEFLSKIKKKIALEK